MYEQNKADDAGTEVDPWELAFAKANGEIQEDDGPSQDGRPSGSEGTDGHQDGNDDVGRGMGSDDGLDGGQLPQAGMADGSDEHEENKGYRSDEDIEAEVRSIEDAVSNDAINQVFNEMMASGNYRTANGKLGSDINDPDIKIVGHDGVVRFYNPDTGRPFTGDDPREQAQQWINRENNRIAEEFKAAIDKRTEELMKAQQPRINNIRFGNKRAELDPIRTMMLETILEDHEIKDDSGNVIGYDCDLDRILAQVNRQVKKIQEYGGRNQAPAQKSGPAMDMGNAGGQSGPTNDGVPKNLEQALLAREQAKLDELKARDERRRNRYGR